MNIVDITYTLMVLIPLLIIAIPTSIYLFCAVGIGILIAKKKLEKFLVKYRMKKAMRYGYHYADKHHKSLCKDINKEFRKAKKAMFKACR